MDRVRHTVRTRCKFCGNPFDSFNLNKVCPTCSENKESYYVRIKQYLVEHPEATADEMQKVLDIPTALIKHLLKEERVMVRSKEKDYVHRCEICEKPIYSGRYCFQCEIVAVRDEMLRLKYKKH